MESKPLILIADDDPDVATLLCRQVREWGYRVSSSGTKAELMAALFQEKPALVLLDLHFGEVNGLELLRQLLDACPDLTIAMLTGNGTIDTAVTAMRLGAYDFLTKPPDSRRVRVLISHAIEKQKLAARVRKLETLAGVAPGLRLLGESPAMKRILALIRSVAPTDATVLILGESGTGKELAARTVHELSRRVDGPFVPLNMAALPRELAESLLFGHEKGAFTGADRAQAGACELAEGGTLFLDEIGEMDLALQSKMLRFLQERTVQRVGNPKPLKLDVRVVAATNRDLLERVRAGHFREDLYYRLNVVPVTLPPLRERREEIPVLAAGFLQKAVLKFHRDTLAFTPAALAAMSRYDWPGNVRQLENMVDRLAILSPGPEIDAHAMTDDFRIVSTTAMEASTDANYTISTSVTPLPGPIPGRTPHPGPLPDGLRMVDQIEMRAIVDALSRASGIVSVASHELGLSQATVYRKLKRYAINLGDFSPVGVAMR